MRTEPVLLVHGFASSFELNWARNGWADLLQDAKRNAIGVDLLGHGSAPKPHDPAAYVDLHTRVLDALPADGSRVDAVGFSLGAMTLIRAINAAPERFARVVLAGIGEANTLPSDPEVVAAAIEKGIASVGGEDAPENRMARAFTQFAANGTNDPKALAACLRRPTGRLQLSELATITSPVLLVCGDRDFVLPLEPLADALVKAESVTTKLVRGVDHFELPQSFGFIDAALSFLDALS